MPASARLWEAELAAVRRATERWMLAQERIIDYWLGKGQNGFYIAYVQDMIERERLNEAEAVSRRRSRSIPR